MNPVDPDTEAERVLLVLEVIGLSMLIGLAFGLLLWLLITKLA